MERSCANPGKREKRAALWDKEPCGGKYLLHWRPPLALDVVDFGICCTSTGDNKPSLHANRGEVGSFTESGEKAWHGMDSWLVHAVVDFGGTWGDGLLNGQLQATFGRLEIRSKQRPVTYESTSHYIFSNCFSYGMQC